MEGSRYKEMKTINLNITALPEPTEYHFFIGSDTLALSSGSAILTLREYGGSARIRGDAFSGEQVDTNRIEHRKGMSMIVLNGSLKLPVQVSNPAIPYLKIHEL